MFVSYNFSLFFLADVFLASVAKVAALGEPSAELADGLKHAHEELLYKTAGPMKTAAVEWEITCQSYAKARTLHVMVQACQMVAEHLERARKQAGLGRPRAALDAVDQARQALATPMESLFKEHNIDPGLWKAATITNDTDDKEKKTPMLSLEETPFGKRAVVMLPKIENEVLMSARRGLNRWFLSLRSGGDGAKIGRAVLRQCAYSVSVGTGQIGLGGHLPPSYVWRAKTADNLISRISQNGKVARAVRQGYWFDRDAPKEAERLEGTSKMGMERRAEALASSFGWYRCWDDNSELLVDPSEFQFDGDGSARSGLSGSRHGLSGSRHGLGGSRHGLRGSRHGRGRSLGFRATTSSRSQAFQDITSTLGTTAAVKASSQSSKWADLLIPSILSASSSSRKEEDVKLMALSESVHPVRRAELAFNLLGRSDEFVQYYEQNRFGDMKIGGDGDDKAEKRSSLSSLSGDDVSVGTDRIFFAKTLPHLSASVIGFSAVEAALELGHFADEDDGKKTKASGTVGTLNASRFRESSERYERALISELGTLLRGRAIRATLAELVRSSGIMAAFRASLKIVHPSSTTRRHDKDLMALDVDILMTALKIAQDEQLRATSAIVADDPKVPMLVSEMPSLSRSSPSKKGAGVPDPEELGLPFGLHQLKQVPQKSDLEFQEQHRTSFNRASPEEAFTFSSSVPVVLRTLHARIIATSAFALTQEELGQKFPDKKGSAAAGYVLDCVEACVSVTAIGMKDSDNVVEEGSVEKAVQVMANISALQHCLPRLFGTTMRGLCHIGLIRAEELDETFIYAEKTLKAADKACDGQVGSTYSLVYEICRTKIDSHLNYSLENFNWVAKSVRDMPNAYCEGLIGYLRSVFASLGPMDEGSRAGLHFSCCGHVSERLVKVFSGKPGDTTSFDDSGLPPISKIDAFGIKNLATDCEEFEKFADGLVRSCCTTSSSHIYPFSPDPFLFPGHSSIARLLQ